MREKYEAELRELERSERTAVEKQQELRKQQMETEGELIRLQAALRQKEQETEEITQVRSIIQREKLKLQLTSDLRLFAIKHTKQHTFTRKWKVDTEIENMTDPVEFLQLPSSGQGQVGGRAPQPGGGNKAGVCRPLGDDGGGEPQVEGGGVRSPSEDAAGGGEGHTGERGRTGRSPPTVSWKGQNDLNKMVNF